MGLSWNLAVFGVLATWAAGTASAGAALSFKDEGRTPTPFAFALAAILTVAGGAVALLGMQHPERIFNLLGNPAAAITQQVYAVIALLVCLILWAILAHRADDGVAPRWSAALVLLAGLATAFTVARRYLMPSMPLLDTWLWVAAGIGAALSMGTATVAAIDALRSEPTGIALSRKAFAGGTALSALGCIAYLASIQMAQGSGQTSGIQFDPTHPASGAAGALLDGGDLGMLWGCGMAVGTLMPLACSLVALLGSNKADGTGRVRVATCGIIAALCAVAGNLCLRGVVFGLL